MRCTQSLDNGHRYLMEGHKFDILDKGVLVWLLQADGHSVDGPIDIIPLDDFLVGSGSVYGGFVHQVLQRRARESWGSSSHLL